MEEHNAKFQLLKKSDILLTDYFEPAPREKSNLMTFTDVVRVLRNKIPSAYMPSIPSLSNALSEHFQSGAVAGNRGWYIRLRQ